MDRVRQWEVQAQFWQTQNNATLHYSATVAEYGNFVGQFTDFIVGIGVARLPLVADTHYTE
jgi:hypothetical protein